MADQDPLDHEVIRYALFSSAFILILHFLIVTGPLPSPPLLMQGIRGLGGFKGPPGEPGNKVKINLSMFTGFSSCPSV